MSFDRRLLLPSLVIAFGMVLVLAAAWLTFSGPGAPPPSSIGGPFQLTDQNGRSVTQDDLKGAPTVIFFGYTHCPDVCPTTLFEVTQIFKKLGESAKVNGAFVTVDPERDTAELLRDYLSSFDPRIRGLTGTQAQLEPMLKAYRVFARKVPGTDGGPYTMDHSAIVYLMDKQMRCVGPLNIGDDDVALKELRKWM
jgi:protein SCO1/2